MTARGRPNRLFAFVRALRPRQWLKNVLVAAVPLAAGRITDLDLAGPIVLTFVAWCLVSSAVYLLNDVFDRERDRENPARAHRPIASGDLPVPAAVTTAVVFATLTVPLTGLLVNSASAALLGTYLGIQIAYSVWIKNEPVFDLAIVASGFFLRAIAGGVATGLELSPWFLLVAIFGALFMVSGKRYSELRSTPEGQAVTRPVLERYSTSFLRFVWTVSAGSTVLTYALWAIEGHGGPPSVWIQASVVPLTLGVLRFALAIDAGRAGDPEDVVLEDRLLLLIGLVFVGLIAVGVTSVR